MNDNIKKTSKLARIMALMGVIILLITIIATFVVALVNFEGSDKLFRALLVADIVIPGLLWVYLMIYRFAKNRDISLQAKLDDIAKNAEIAENADIAEEKRAEE